LSPCSLAPLGGSLRPLASTDHLDMPGTALDLQLVDHLAVAVHLDHLVLVAYGKQRITVG